MADDATIERLQVITPCSVLWLLEDLYESVSEGELCSRSEESKSREIESDAEIDSVVEKRIPDVGRVAMFQKLTEWRMSLWKQSINSSNILIGESHCRFNVELE